MALIICPHCAKEISDRAGSCPHCGYRATPSSPHAQGVGVIEDSPAFSGSIFDFGIFNCLKTEANNFWMRSWGKSIYISKAHGIKPLRRIDKTKEQILKTWALGLLGVLGLHLFPVGRFIIGAMRFLYGALMLIIGIAVSVSSQAAQEIDSFRVMLVFFAAAFIPSGIDLILILSGKFRDVFRSHVN